MAERRWWPGPEAAERIREHLERQRGVAIGFVRLDNDEVVREGHLTDGEGGEFAARDRT